MQCQKQPIWYDLTIRDIKSDKEENFICSSIDMAKMIIEQHKTNKWQKITVKEREEVE